MGSHDVFQALRLVDGSAVGPGARRDLDRSPPEGPRLRSGNVDEVGVAADAPPELVGGDRLAERAREVAHLDVGAGLRGVLEGELREFGQRPRHRQAACLVHPLAAQDRREARHGAPMMVSADDVERAAMKDGLHEAPIGQRGSHGVGVEVGEAGPEGDERRCGLLRLQAAQS